MKIFNFEKWSAIVVSVYFKIWYVFLVKWAFASALLFYRLSLESDLKKESSPNQQAEIRVRMDKVYSLILAMGNTGRDIGIMGAIGFALYVLILTIHWVAEYIFKQTLEDTSRTGLLSFLERETYESEQLASRISDILREIKLSNRTSRDIMYRFGSVRGNPNLRPASNLNHATTFDKSRKICRIGSREGDDIRVSNEYIKRIRMQYSHLEYLNEDKSRIWPINRDSCCHKSTLLIYFYLTASCHIACWFAGTSATYFTNYIAYLAIKSNTNNEAQFRSLSKLEHLDNLMQVLFSHNRMDWFIDGATYTIFSFLDQSKHLMSIRKQLVRFNAKLLLLRRLRSEQSLTEFLESNINVDSKEMRQIKSVRENSIKELQFQFDCESLEIYLAFRILVEEVRHMFKRSSCFVCMNYCALIPIFVFVLLPVSSYPSMANSFTGVSIFIIYLLNQIIFPSALLNNRCLQTTKLIWSLLANATHLSYPELDPDLAHNKLLVKTNTEKPEIRIEHLIMLSSPLTSHSMYLWRQFVFDYDLMSRKFSCHLLGFAQLNFSTTLKMNFYLASFAILTIGSFQFNGKQ